MKHNLENITSQKWGARHIGEPHDHKSGGYEPLGQIGVYAYARLDRKTLKAARESWAKYGVTELFHPHKFSFRFYQPSRNSGKA